LIDRIRLAAVALPGWRASLFFRSGQTTWREIQEGAMRPGHPVLLCQGLSFEGFPFLLRVTGNRAFLVVDLVLLPYPREWPEHPLKTLDRLLRCHERLLPDGVRPLAVSGWPRRGWESVGRFAERFLTGDPNDRVEEARSGEDSNS
jgi:hypothetical protein